MFLLQKRIFVFKGAGCQTGGDNTSTLAKSNCFMLIDVESFLLPLLLSIIIVLYVFYFLTITTNIIEN